MINYSIIIPHKNSIELLDYCLASIPVRDDVEVIVVDDNSDAGKVDFSHFPKWKGAKYELYLTKEGKGAGYCRNVGLDHAKGKWVLFVDADDYVLPCISELFDRCIDSEADIIFFRPKAVMLKDRMTKSMRASAYNDIIDRYQKTGDENDLRVLFFSPICKFIRRSIIEIYSIRFDEIRFSNDNFFSTAIGCYAKKIEACDDTYYVITQGNNSLTSNFLQKPGELQCRAGAFMKSASMASSHGYNYNQNIAFDFMRRLIRNDNNLYCHYFNFVRKTKGYTRLELFRQVFHGFSRKRKLKYYLYSELITRLFNFRHRLWK